MREAGRAGRHVRDGHARRAKLACTLGLFAGTNPDMTDIQAQIEDAFEHRDQLDHEAVRPAVEAALGLLESGQRRVAEPDGQGGWKVQQWLKKAVLLYFRISGNRVVDGGPAQAFDKVPLRFAHGHDAELENLGARVVP